MYKPKTQQTFFCNKCDCNLIDSENPDTGTFYVQFGHAWCEDKKEYDGTYTGVMFALCSECDDK